MRFFFLICTMLITASKAFPEEFYERLNSTGCEITQSVPESNSRLHSKLDFVANVKPHRNKINSLNFNNKNPMVSDMPNGNPVKFESLKKWRKKISSSRKELRKRRRKKSTFCVNGPISIRSRPVSVSGIITKRAGNEGNESYDCNNKIYPDRRKSHVHGEQFRNVIEKESNSTREPDLEGVNKGKRSTIDSTDLGPKCESNSGESISVNIKPDWERRTNKKNSKKGEKFCQESGWLPFGVRLKTTPHLRENSSPLGNVFYKIKPQPSKSMLRETDEDDDEEASTKNKSAHRREASPTDEKSSETSPMEESEGDDSNDDLLKLKYMLEEVEAMLKGRSSKSEGKKSNSSRGAKEVPTNSSSDETIKDKIDNYAIPILLQVSEELSQKEGKNNTSKGKTFKKTGSAKSVRTGVKKKLSKCDPGCSPDGFWLSSALRVGLNMTVLPNLVLKVGIKASKKSCIINKKWFMQGLTMSKRGGPLVLAAACPEKRKLASFVGQCKVCEGEDRIFGIWTFSSCSAKCNDVWTGIETKPDTLKRKRGKQAIRKAKKGKQN